MFDVKVLSGQLIPYKNKQGQDRELFEMWIQFEGVPYSFKMVYFNANQISKAQAAVAAGKAKFDLKPDRNVAPSFELV